MDYQPRCVDPLLSRMLSLSGAVLLEGVRACGKTETGRQHSNSRVLLDVESDMRQLAAISPALVLQGAVPRLIDEWQLVPELWNHVRRTVDERREPGQFILAGSQTPADDITRHSGAGRILRLRMRPMTLSESGASNGRVSLESLLRGDGLEPVRNTLEFTELVEALCRGGWPGLRHLTAVDAQVVLRSYLDDVARVDLPSIDGTSRDPARVSRVLRAYARHVSTPAAMSTIAADTGGAGGAAVSVDTVGGYLAVLERVMVVEEASSWAPHLRSKDAVRKGAVRHFVDPSLAVAALGAGPDSLLRDLNTLGLLFESLVVRDLRVYAQLIDGTVHHYRDSAGVEADAVIQLRDGRWAAVEVKLSPDQVDAAAASLDKLVTKIDIERSGDPVARIVITAAGAAAYTRPDGVHVVPIGCLGA